MIDFNNPISTRGGNLDVIIDATDRGGAYPVHGALKNAKGIWLQYCWQLNGNLFESPHVSDNDLINIVDGDES